ncbi:glycine--tRNA ligase [Mycoplasma zalophi]|uniref:glycine--tRNA ligase n=1 Tax=Mycoplasma zalophi TaxID=191287 RepID=A0ABS6DR87_9MOLU|nr:glycine--tRNA ligase [Mycoplasma zalophi]MBU4690727.1 glycine--tRNA ligase [Mycoplasma zalophi]MBU4692457.1 glycine--tRNA ligase [Mycoplasma zalophi]
MLNKDKNIQEIINHLKVSGFVYQDSEIYGGVINTWDYGPLATNMLNALKNQWIQSFIFEEENNYQIDSKIIMNPMVWKASGHLENFSDFLIENKVNQKRYRADHILKDLFKDLDVEKMTHDEMEQKIKNEVLEYDGVKCDWTEIRPFNLMFKTQAGAIDNTASTTFLRPETAQGIFVNFKNVLRTMRPKLPFGIGQIGKSFRNEITPRDFIFRTREFEQMELEFFCYENQDEHFYNYYIQKCYDFCLKNGLKQDSIRIRAHEKEELSHYSKGTSDIEFLFPFGWGELMGIANRGNYDLSQHIKFSNENLYYLTDEGEKVIPYVIEPSMGLDRLLFAILVDAYEVETLENNESRTVLRTKYKVSPYQVCVMPLVKKLTDESKKIFKNLKSKGIRVSYEESGSIGKRYRRQDAIGTYFSITFDYDSLEDNKVTIRHRDTMQQERISIDDIEKYLESYNDR